MKTFDIQKHKYIMVQILKDIFTHKEVGPIMGFKGGTACYLFFNLPRFSVDLDFNLLDINKKDIVFNNFKNTLQEYGNLKQARDKKKTIFFLLSYKKNTKNIKIEISKRQFPDKYQIRNYLGISMNVMVKEDIFAHKLVALLDRKSIANRDLFDIWYFFKNNWDINEKIIEVRTENKFTEYMKRCIKRVEKINETYILQGLGEVLDEQRKDWVKNNLKSNLIFLMKNYLVNIGDSA